MKPLWGWNSLTFSNFPIFNFQCQYLTHLSCRTAWEDVGCFAERRPFWPFFFLEKRKNVCVCFFLKIDSQLMKLKSKIYNWIYVFVFAPAAFAGSDKYPCLKKSYDQLLSEWIERQMFKSNEIVKVLPTGFPIIQRRGREMVCIAFIALSLKFGPPRGE